MNAHEIGELVWAHLAPGDTRPAVVVQVGRGGQTEVELASGPTAGQRVWTHRDALSRRTKLALSPEARSYEVDAEVVDIEVWGTRATVIVAFDDHSEARVETDASAAPRVGESVRVVRRGHRATLPRIP